MAKAMCLIQSNKTKKCTANSFIYYYLVRVGSVLPGYVNFLSSPVPGGMRGGGSRASQPVTKIYLGIPPLFVMAFRGGILGP